MSPGKGSMAYPKGPTAYERAKAKELIEDSQQDDVYRLVDKRDQRCCRVCGKYVPVNAIGVLNRGHHHHVLPRSLGGPDETWNIALLCAGCHQDEHDTKIRLSGNADDRDPLTGKLNGLKLEVPAEEGWQIERWC